MRKLAIAVLCLFFPALAAAQAWPSKPIKVIVPFPAGGGTDFIGRLAAKQLGDRLGQTVYVENRGGANGGIGVQAVAQAEPDGYTLGAISDTPITVNPALYPKLAYEPLRDLAPVALINRFPSMLVAHPSVPVKSVAELIALARAKPGTLNYSSGGIGNFSHLGLELLGMKAGIKLVHVPYRGVGPATAAVVAGDVQLMYNNVATALEYVRAGKLTAIAVGEPRRLPALPDIPAIAETVPGFEQSAWVGVFAPVKTPRDIVARVSREVAALLKDPEVTRIFADQQIVAAYEDSDEFARHIRRETDNWAGVIKTLGIKAE
ncbi:MAG TPA: tripartite tricarboxylate transporter substrate binding protein [Burkholderiales bacterium]|nr:tripartite tricarboxylate transporter substrate binding protein [Burkholderiales bacterium]